MYSTHCLNLECSTIPQQLVFWCFLRKTLLPSRLHDEQSLFFTAAAHLLAYFGNKKLFQDGTPPRLVWTADVIISGSRFRPGRGGSLAQPQRIRPQTETPPAT